MTHIFTNPVVFFCPLIPFRFCAGGKKKIRKTLPGGSVQRGEERQLGYLVDKLSSARVHTHTHTTTDRLTHIHKNTHNPNNEYLPSCQQLNMQIDATFMSVHLNTLLEPEGD